MAIYLAASLVDQIGPTIGSAIFVVIQTADSIKPPVSQLPATDARACQREFRSCNRQANVQF